MAVKSQKCHGIAPNRDIKPPNTFVLKVGVVTGRNGHLAEAEKGCVSCGNRTGSANETCGLIGMDGGSWPY
jgi:hypothetical protein